MSYRAVICVQNFRMKWNRLIHSLPFTLLFILLFLCPVIKSMNSGNNGGDQLNTQSAPSCCPDCVIFCLGGGLAGGLVVVVVCSTGVFVWKRRKPVTSEAFPVRKRRKSVIRDVDFTVMKKLMEKLGNQREKAQEELDEWAAVIKEMTELMEQLGNQRQDFREQMEETEREEEENKAGGLVVALVCITGVFLVQKCIKSVMKELVEELGKKREKATDKIQGSQKTQEELDEWAAVIKGMTELMEELGNQRQDFREQMEETEREEEENKKKIQLMEEKIAESEKEKATDKTQGYLREKQNLLTAKWKLENRKGQLEKQKLDTEKLLEKTKDLKETATERKRKVENYMELINLLLEETESQSETAQLLPD